jgi:hypothetical protein
VSGGAVGTWHGAWNPEHRLPENEWTHVVATFDGSALALYVNGVRLQTATYRRDGALEQVERAALTLGTSAEPLYLGAYRANGQGRFGGRIDDVRIFNVALDDAAVSDLFNASSSPSGVRAPLGVRMAW